MDAKMNDFAMATVERQCSSAGGVKMAGYLQFIARDKDGGILWIECVKNLATTQGLNDLLTNYFKGSSYTAAFYMGLINNANFSTLAASDTAAKITTGSPSGGTNGWSESGAYSGSRPTLTLGSASAGSISNTSSPAVFNINAMVTINGAFLATNATIGSASGILYSEVSFGTTRSFSGSGGETLTVTYTLTAASA